MTRSDWFGGAYTDAAGTTYTNFAEGWFTQAWNNTSTGLQSYFKKLNPTATVSQAFNLFKLGGNNYGPQRFSDPNVTAISKDASGNVNFSLAGHFEHSTGFKLSEVVKVTYNGETNLFYGFGDAVASGVVSKDDGVSHSGLYNFTIPGEETASVPEPASLLGLVAVGGLMAAKRKFQ
ncbi:MAG: PEP-CTERM sorting domain-containing protein [Coleofasciculaceae cyanobacterium SM2_3_26]|nr:PEP-CTERM sorting domain-containing protein [Coleofasciculaceae cyanobacterium SM2_3_26]